MAIADGQFEALRKLPENWDGYGAAAPQARAIDLARSITGLIDAGLRKSSADSHPFHISPTRVGGVLIEWEHGVMEHEVEVNPDASISFLHRNRSTGHIDTRQISPVPLQLELLQELQQLLAA
ncbi:MAG: hypothetical protein HY289_15480 [Planctomycetes bacterium]|nr:hypothetical protein [Planctomycetota bacterium]